MKTNQNSVVNGEIKNPENVEELDSGQENGNIQSDSDTPEEKKSDLKKKKKNKSKQKDKQLLKKEARILREKAMSEGFEPFKFSTFTMDNQSNEGAPLQNGNAHTEQTSPNTKKRMLKSISDGNKSKKRKSMQTD